MDCARVNQKIELFVLGELPESERVAIKAHLATCPACKTAEDEYRSLVAEIKDSAQPDSPEAYPQLVGGFDFARRVRLAVKAEIRSAARRSRVRRTIAVTGSIAACLLFAFVIRHAWVSSGSKVGPAVAKNPSREPSGRARSALGAPPVLQAWEYRGARSVPGLMADGLVVRGQNMYLLQEYDGLTYVAAVDIKTGKQKWLSDIQSYGYLLADDSRVYCLAPSAAGPADGGLDPARTFGLVDLVALDAANGETLWRHPQQRPEPLRSPCRPTLLPTDRICWTTNTTIHVLGCADGKLLWTHSIPDGGLLSAASVADDGLYVANSIGLYCLNTATGRESRTVACDDIKSSPDRPLLTAADGKIYVSLGLGFRASRLLCMELTGHKILWSKVVARVSHLHAVGDLLYLRDQNIRALDRATGQLLWTYPATGCNPVTYAEGLAYFVDSSHQGRLLALNGQTGSKVWELAGMRSCNAFIKVDGTGFLKTNDGVVHAVSFEG